MIYALLVLVIGLSISGVAAFYSIVGLTTIFSGSVMAVAIMGSVLEVGKLITASWLYRNWNKVGFLIKTYLTIAVFVLMFITSMGIFGYLSKAHIQQTGVSGGTELQVELIDHKIGREQKQIDDAENVIVQLDKAVQILMDYDRVRGPTGAIAVRQGQKEERKSLNDVIDASSESIGELQEKKIVLERSQIEMEVEVGPIKYIAELIYGEEEAKGLLDEAVRAVILILIFVFDPLAVLLLIAASISLEQVSTNKKKEKLMKKEPQQAPTKAEMMAELMEDIEKNPALKDLYTEAHPPKPSDIEDVWVSELAKQIGEDIDKEIIADLLANSPADETVWPAAVLPVATDIVTVPGSVNKALLEELMEVPKKPKQQQIPDLHEQVMIHNGIYDADDDGEEAPIVIKPDWTEKILNDGMSKEALTAAIDSAYADAKKSANIPFNLDGAEGDVLKKILLKALADSKDKS